MTDQKKPSKWRRFLNAALEFVGQFLYQGPK